MSQERQKYAGTKLLASNIRNWYIYKVITPVENLCVSLNITPNQLTIGGFILNLFAAVAFACGQFFIGGTIIVLAGNLDFLDGKIARATGQSTAHGAYLDSVTDRYTDAVLFLGLAVFYQHSWVLYPVLLALFGSGAVSYTKARAEAINVPCKVGLMQRPERILYLGSGAILSSFVTTTFMPFVDSPRELPHVLLIATIVIIAIFSNITAIQRIVHVIRHLIENPS